MGLVAVVSHLLFQCIGTDINPSKKPSLLRLVHTGNFDPSKMLHELGKRYPSQNPNIIDGISMRWPVLAEVPAVPESALNAL